MVVYRAGASNIAYVRRHFVVSNTHDTLFIWTTMWVSNTGFNFRRFEELDLKAGVVGRNI